MTLEALTADLRGPLRPYLSGDAPCLLARAPGRMDVFGGIIDYTGGTVCELPLAAATWAALQPREDRVLRVHSRGLAQRGLRDTVAVDLDGLLQRDYAAARDWLGGDPNAAWVRHVVGAWQVLHHEGLVAGYPGGADVVVAGDVPLAAGLSSSASLEIAVLYALLGHLGLQPPPKQVARLGQIVENQVVGAPCGLMDQLTAVLGQADHLLVIRCRPDDILANGPVPAGARFGAIHTGVAHHIAGARYANARVAAFMGHAILLDRMRQDGLLDPGQDPFEGYLSQVPWETFENEQRQLLPACISGAEFLAQYGETVDRATRIDPSADYRVAAATAHHIEDNVRASQFLAALERFGEHGQAAWLDLAGSLMLASHHSYRDNVGLGAPEADILLHLALELGPAAGVYGGRISGGGCGGSVVFLGDARLDALLPRIAAAYQARTALEPTVILGSSDGAAAGGVREVRL